LKNIKRFKTYKNFEYFCILKTDKMKKFTKKQRILFAIGIMLGCGSLNYFFNLKNIYPNLADLLQGLLQGTGIGIVLAIILFGSRKYRFKSRTEV
jgi:hypothetical protein